MDNSLSTTISTAGTGLQTPWPAGAQAFPVLARGLRFINPTSSGAFDFSLNAGTSWHTRSMSAGFYTEDFPTAFNVNDVRVRRNGATDVAGLSVDAFF